MAKNIKKVTPSKKKSNLKVLSIFDSFKSLIDTKLFTQKLSIKNLLIYSVISLMIFVIISIIKTSIMNSSTQIISPIFYLIISIPIIFIIFYGFLYIVLNSFENTKKPFFESFLVFSSIIMPFMIIGDILILLSTFFLFGFISSLISALIVINIIALFINFLFGFKNYYKTSIFKLITSLIIVEIFFGVLAILQYLAVLLNS